MQFDHSKLVLVLVYHLKYVPITLCSDMRAPFLLFNVSESDKNFLTQNISLDEAQANSLYFEYELENWYKDSIISTRSSEASFVQAEIEVMKKFGFSHLCLRLSSQRKGFLENFNSKSYINEIELVDCSENGLGGILHFSILGFKLKKATKCRLNRKYFRYVLQIAAKHRSLYRESFWYQYWGHYDNGNLIYCEKVNGTRRLHNTWAKNLTLKTGRKPFI